MKVYLLWEGNVGMRRLRGVFASLDGAKRAAQKEWDITYKDLTEECESYAHPRATLVWVRHWEKGLIAFDTGVESTASGFSTAHYAFFTIEEVEVQP